MSSTDSINTNQNLREFIATNTEGITSRSTYWYGLGEKSKYFLNLQKMLAIKSDIKRVSGENDNETSNSKVFPSKLDLFLSIIDVLWEKIAALIEFSRAVVF